MGQQQLLLLVLGIVLVGLAVVVGIQSFAEQKRKASMEQTVATAVDMAARLIAWKLTPAALGGGASEVGLGPLDGGVTLADLSYTTNGTEICNYAQSQANTRGDNCVITEHGEFHVARGAMTGGQAGGIGYIHAISRYETRTFRVQIIAAGSRLYTNLDDFRNARAALPMP